MEKKLLEVAEEALKQPGVTGYICVDNEGLCLTAAGQAKQSMAGVIQQLTALTSKIQPGEQSPVIRLDLDKYKLTIQSQKDVTVGLMR